MRLAARPLLTFAVLYCIVLVAEDSLVAESSATPPLFQPPQSGVPGQTPTGPPPQLTSTGLTENGGSIVNGVYTNSIYGFSLNIPPGWVVVPPPKTPPIATEGASQSLPKGAHPIRMFLIVTENAPFKKNYERKSLQISVVPLSAPSGPDTARDFLNFSERSAKQKGLAVQYQGDPEQITINGQRVCEAKLQETINGTVQHIEEYAVAAGRTVLQFMLVSPDPEGLKAMQPSIKSLRLEDATKKAPPKKAAASKRK